jgi:hypothetical protein
MKPEQALAQSFEQIKNWMADHDAGVLSQNLAPGASAEELDDAEEELEFPLGPELRALWSLHNGQHEEMNGFVESYDLFSLDQAISGRDSLLPALQFLRQAPEAVQTSGLTDAELHSDAWLPFAGRDSDGLALNTVSGRVFKIFHDDSPPLHLHSPSLVAWANRYASRVAAGDYRVEEGFGDCYLRLRDRAAEKMVDELKRHQQAEKKRKKKMSVKELLDEAVSQNNESAALEVLERAEKKSPAVLAEALSVLFATSASPSFLAATLRTMLNRLTLSADKWQIVAEGGTRLGNNAIRDIALAKARAAPPN